VPPPIPLLADCAPSAIRLDPPLSEEARLTATTRERVSQVMKMMRLAPDIQDEILRLPPMRRRQRAITVPEVTAIAEEIVWDDQRESWRKLKQQNGLSEE